MAKYINVFACSNMDLPRNADIFTFKRFAEQMTDIELSIELSFVAEGKRAQCSSSPTIDYSLYKTVSGFLRHKAKSAIMSSVDVIFLRGGDSNILSESLLESIEVAKTNGIPIIADGAILKLLKKHNIEINSTSLFQFCKDLENKKGVVTK